jgi:hypothetical protein
MKCILPRRYGTRWTAKVVLLLGVVALQGKCYGTTFLSALAERGSWSSSRLHTSHIAQNIQRSNIADIVAIKLSRETQRCAASRYFRTRHLHVGAASDCVLFLCDMKGVELNRTLLEIGHNGTPEMNVIEYFHAASSDANSRNAHQVELANGLSRRPFRPITIDDKTTGSSTP